jgi:hypothetical protein
MRTKWIAVNHDRNLPDGSAVLSTQVASTCINYWVKDFDVILRLIFCLQLYANFVGCRIRSLLFKLGENRYSQTPFILTQEAIMADNGINNPVFAMLNKTLRLQVDKP